MGNREGEVWAYRHDGHSHDLVSLFVVVRSQPQTVGKDEVWFHTILVLDSLSSTLAAGHTWEVIEDLACEVFTHHYRQID